MDNPFQEIDQRIWKSLVEKPQKERRYIGASIVGHPCDRRIWLEWKGLINPRQYQDEEKIGQKLEIFQRGNEEEEIFIKKLQDAGYTIKDRQWEFSVYDGKLQGHCDGVIVDDEGYEYIFEFKTMKSTVFNRLVLRDEKKKIIGRKGKIEDIYPNYIYQVQMYLAHKPLKTKDGIKRALIGCQNKDIDFERIYEIHSFKPEMITGTQARVERIISYEDDMPARLCAPEKPSYICKMCDYFKFCYPEQV